MRHFVQIVFHDLDIWLKSKTNIYAARCLLTSGKIGRRRLYLQHSQRFFAQNNTKNKSKQKPMMEPPSARTRMDKNIAIAETWSRRASIPSALLISTLLCMTPIAIPAMQNGWTVVMWFPATMVSVVYTGRVAEMSAVLFCERRGPFYNAIFYPVVGIGIGVAFFSFTSILAFTYFKLLGLTP